MPTAHVMYFTDPIYPQKWATEPAVRGLQTRFGVGVAISYFTGCPPSAIADPQTLPRGASASVGEAVVASSPPS